MFLGFLVSEDSTVKDFQQMAGKLAPGQSQEVSSHSWNAWFGPEREDFTKTIMPDHVHSHLLIPGLKFEEAKGFGIHV